MTLVRVELHSLVFDVGISPLIPVVSVKFHSWGRIVDPLPQYIWFRLGLHLYEFHSLE